MVGARRRTRCHRVPLWCRLVAVRDRTHDRVYRMGYQHAPPAQLVDAEGRPKGAVVEAIKVAAERSGIKLQWVLAPEGPDAAFAGKKVDLWPIIAKLPARERLIHITDPYLKLTYWAVTLYEPTAASSAPIRADELLLLDVWGKLQAPGSVFYDITWVGFLGADGAAEIREGVRGGAAARDRAVSFVQGAVAAKRTIEGWKVDYAAREVIRIAGYAEYFVHRLGHNIGEEIHGNGANMDGFETRDVRRVLPHTCFSVEPGIYLPEFGIRSEVNVFVDEKEARVTGPAQTEILALLA